MQNSISYLKKGIVSKMPIITIHIKSEDKESLNKEAEKLGMQLTTYCRMILLKTVKGN